jgi:hypothetical protein
VLKHHGYHLEHNFGHRQEHTGEIYALLNLLVFQMHEALLLLDEGYKKVRASIRRRDEFFGGRASYSTGIFFKPGKNLSALLCLKISPMGKCRIAEKNVKKC